MKRLLIRGLATSLVLLGMGLNPGLAWTKDVADQTARFSIQEYRVLGNTALPSIELERVLYQMLGEDKTIDDVEAARQALEELYRNKGFGAVYVDIPEQQVEDGVVRLQVTEGRLDRIRVTGARHYSNRRILAELPSLQSGEVLNLPTLQRELTALNQQTRDREVTPVLKGGSAPGSVDVSLVVKDAVPLHGTVEVNDRYTANTTRTRLALSLSYDNLFQSNQSLALGYQGSPEDMGEIRMLSATYLIPMGKGMLALYGIDTNSDFAAAGSSAALAILGKGRIYGGRYVSRLLMTGESQQTLTFGADYKRFLDSIQLSGGATDLTPMTYLGWTVAYGGNWRDSAPSTPGPSRSTGLNLSVNFGIRGLVNDPVEFEYKRFNARPNYIHVRGDLQHEQPLFAANSLYLRASGQWTADPLISNEQFASGGADSVRGFLESESLGDVGASASVEWRLPPLNGFPGAWAQRLMGMFFYDMGQVGILDPLPDATGRVVRSKRLSSAGAGLRLSTSFGLTGTLDWAYPLRDGDYTHKGDSRVHLQVRYGF